ncbi:MAG TPA: glycosyltransferase family 2 protein [Solirubrobacteraceae bacterium]|nr:glycosyltransferase family 2 protein [Solirubrobacteraceae bacterium]
MPPPIRSPTLASAPLAAGTRSFVASLLLTAGAGLGAATGYLVGLLVAASRARAVAVDRAQTRLPHRLLILVPAHDEEQILPHTLRAVARLDYPQARSSVVVIADNCTDATAEVARTGGARVLVRCEPDCRGKGQALAWALRRLDEELGDTDAVVFLDADCEPSPNLLAAFDARLHGGARAAQAAYLVANPEESWTSALRWAAFALMNLVRPLGKSTLGLSSGILGTGFVLRCDLLEQVPWEAFSLAEDAEYHLRLVNAGERVVFAAEAAVLSRMPTSLAASQEQNLRWEAGRWHLLRTWAPTLLREGLRRRDVARLHAGLEPLVPPQSLLLFANAVVLAGAVVLRVRRARTVALANAVGQAFYVLGGLRVAHAPRCVYAAMAHAPLLVLWKLGLQLRILRGQGPAAWIGTRADHNPR